MRPTASFVLAMTATAAFSDPIISEAALCEKAAPLDWISEFGLQLNGTGLFGIDYECNWSDVPDFQWQRAAMASAVGYCAGLNPDGDAVVIPQVFTFETTDQEPGLIVIYSSDPDNRELRFYDCAVYEPNRP